ncbi:MAG: fatty acid desaturase, partial [Pseudomonadota bacterium]
MDHKTFIASLSSDAKLDLTAKSDRAGIVHLCCHVGLLLIGAVWIGFGWPLWWAVLPLYGITLVFLFTLEHECTHQTPFASTSLNEWVGRLCGVVMILPFEWFRSFHLAHHRWTNIPGKDPEIAEPRPETWGQFVWFLTG